MERDAESAAHSAACASILTVEKCVYVPTYVLGVGIYHVTTGAPRLRSGDKNRERETRGKWEGEKKNRRVMPRERGGFWFPQRKFVTRPDDTEKTDRPYRYGSVSKVSNVISSALVSVVWCRVV